MRRSLLAVVALVAGTVSLIATQPAAPLQRVTAWVTIPQLGHELRSREQLLFMTDRLIAALQDGSRWTAAGVDVNSVGLSTERIGESPVVTVTVRGRDPQQLSTTLERVGVDTVSDLLAPQLATAKAAARAARRDYERVRSPLDVTIRRAGAVEPELLNARYDRAVRQVLENSRVVSGQLPPDADAADAAAGAYRSAQDELRSAASVLATEDEAVSSAAEEWRWALAAEQDALVLHAAAGRDNTVRVMAVGPVPDGHRWLHTTAVALAAAVAALAWVAAGRSSAQPASPVRSRRVRTVDPV